MTKKTRAKTRRALLSLSLVLVTMMVAVGGTIAWLTDSSDTIVNTFAPTGIDIDLTETDNNNGNPFELVPGMKYDKNPIVSVNHEITDVDIYLFVKFEEKGNPSAYLDYTSTLKEENGWAPVSEGSNVWYRVVEADADVTSWNLLEGNKVTVKDLEKDAMPTGAVTLEYTAYAIQVDGFDDVAYAWAEASTL